MATLTARVPDDVEEEFNAAVPESQRDSVLTDLVRRATREYRDLPQARLEAANRLQDIRHHSKTIVSDDEIARAREELRSISRS